MSREIKIHHLEHARIAFSLAQELGISITISTPPHALGYASVDYFNEIFHITQFEYQEVQAKQILDCSGYPGMVTYALRQGVTHVRYIDDQKFTQQLQSMAQQKGATILIRPPENVIDLLDYKNASKACYSWLASRIASKSCSVL